AAGEMFGARVVTQFKDVAQHCPALPTRGKLSGLHCPGNGNNRLTIGIVGIVDQCAAVRTRLKLAPSLRGCQVLQRGADFVEIHVSRAACRGRGQRDGDTVFTWQAQLHACLPSMIIQREAAPAQRIASDVAAAYLCSLTKSEVEDARPR